MVVSAGERDLPGDALDQHQPEGVDVGLPVDRLAPGLLRRGVAGGAEHGALRLGPGRLGQGPGEAEVGDAQAAVVAEQEVGGLDVAVDEAPRGGRSRGRGWPRARPAAPATASAGAGVEQCPGCRRRGTR